MDRGVSQRIYIPENMQSELLEIGIHVDDLVLYINSSCNLRCTHCYVGNELLSQSKFIDGKSATTFLYQLESLSRITILGGEPTLHPAFVEIVSAASSLQISDKRITTNLTSIKAIYAAESVLRGYTISVSLDGATRLLHDQVRGEGTFDKTTKNIYSLCRAGFDIEITHTLMRSNIASFPRFLELCKELGVISVNLHRMSLHGNAIANAQNQITPDEWVEFTRWLEKKSQENMPLGITVRYPPLFTTLENYQSLIHSGCYQQHAKGSFYSGKGGQRIVVYPDGKLYISSEAFGTESYIASFQTGSLVYNDKAQNELSISENSNYLMNTVPVVNPRQSGSKKYPAVLSVSYKNFVEV